jgi:hypothetical protein
MWKYECGNWTRFPALLNRDVAALGSALGKPIASEVDCTPRGSDHCIVHGTFEVR